MAVLTAAAAVKKLAAAQWLGLVGQRSLEIFVAHIIFASGTRIALSMLGFTDTTFQIVAGTVAGVVGPLLLWLVARRLGVDGLFELPKWLSRRVEVSNHEQGGHR